MFTENILVNEDLSFTTSYTTLNKSFTINKLSIISVEARYSNARPTSIGVKGSESDGATSLMLIWIDKDKISNTSGLRTYGILPAGTYYLWGNAETNGTNGVVVRAYNVK